MDGPSSMRRFLIFRISSVRLISASSYPDVQRRSRPHLTSPHRDRRARPLHELGKRREHNAPVIPVRERHHHIACGCGPFSRLGNAESLIPELSALRARCQTSTLPGPLCGCETSLTARGKAENGYEGWSRRCDPWKASSARRRTTDASCGLSWSNRMHLRTVVQKTGSRKGLHFGARVKMTRCLQNEQLNGRIVLATTRACTSF